MNAVVTQIKIYREWKLSVDKNFALIAKNGDVLFPYKKHELSSGRYGFAISEPGKSDKKANPNDEFGQAVYTTDIEQVIERVVLRGWGMRAKKDAGLHPKREGTVRLGKGEFGTYYVTPEFRHLVVGAPVAPIATLPFRGSTSSRKPNQVESQELRRIESLSSAEFTEALLSIDSKMTALQREMLVLHANSANSITTLDELGHLAGDIDFASTRDIYAALADLLRGYLNVGELPNSLDVLATSMHVENESGRTQWHLRPQMLDALRVSGYWSDPSVDGDVNGELTVAIDADIGADERPTTRQSLIEARIGQGAFRKKMLFWWDGRCAVTGCRVTKAIVASHAVPWNTSTNIERLDHFNGLPLIATLDRLFDSGLISFTQTGKILIHTDLSQQDRMTLGLNDGIKIRKPLHDRHEPYLRRHRETHKLSA